MRDTYSSLNHLADRLATLRDHQLPLEMRWDVGVTYPGSHPMARLRARVVEFSQDQFVDPEGHKFYGHKGLECRAFHFELYTLGAKQGYWTVTLFKYPDPEADLGREIMTSEIHRRAIPYGVMMEMDRLVEEIFKCAPRKEGTDTWLSPNPVQPCTSMHSN